ncbi:MAG: hypothetical protein JST92_04920 [Deltaproteobacteria bacterium]|nr:hypothetical protein [Deltaproteobacteria bacterium]
MRSLFLGCVVVASLFACMRHEKPDAGLVPQGAAVGQPATPPPASTAAEPQSAATQVVQADDTAVPAKGASQAPKEAPPAAASTSTPAVAEIDACTADADCAFTHIDDGACCPMLCSPRVVSKKRAASLDQNLKTCAPKGGCPLPFCRPPRFQETPKCEAGRCVAERRRIEP